MMPRKKIRKTPRDLGFVPTPSKVCDDPNCPFTGSISVRGQFFEGVVVSDRMDKTVTVKREYLAKIPKYKRYARRTQTFKAHNPPCIDAKEGDKVIIGETRPISKTKSFVVLQILESGATSS